MVSVGIIGLGPHWDTRYRPALEAMHRRIRIRAVYDAVSLRAHQVAREMGGTVYHGMLSLVRAPDVQAVLLLDAAWHGNPGLNLICSSKKPVYIVGDLCGDIPALNELHRSSQAEGITLMPELGRRYTPASARLKELIATRIGAPRQIRITAHRSGAQSEPSVLELVDLFDWCRYIARTPPIAIRSEPLGGSSAANSADRVLTIEFGQGRAGGPPVVAIICLHCAADETGSAHEAPHPRLEVQCDRGRAIITSTVEITWLPESGESIVESLATERSEVEVMLDQFTRRVVGGLIPVADIGDICRGMELAQAAAQSWSTRQTLRLNGHA